MDAPPIHAWMQDSTRTAVLLGGLGALCGGCVSLASVLLGSLAATFGVAWFFGLVVGIPAGVIVAVALYLRLGRRDEACEVPDQV